MYVFLAYVFFYYFRLNNHCLLVIGILARRKLLRDNCIIEDVSYEQYILKYYNAQC